MRVYAGRGNAQVRDTVVFAALFLAGNIPQARSETCSTARMSGPIITSSSTIAAYPCAAASFLASKDLNRLRGGAPGIESDASTSEATALCLTVVYRPNYNCDNGDDYVCPGDRRYDMQ